MSFTPNFTISQALATPSILSFTDTSSGSDGAIVGRKITLLKSDGTYILHNYTWALANLEIDVDCLNRDYGLSVTVDWVNVSGTVLYTKNYKLGFVAYTTNFLMGLTQQETGLPSIISNRDYWTNKLTLQTLLDDANQSIIMGSDYKKAQTFLDWGYSMINNQNTFF